MKYIPGNLTQDSIRTDLFFPAGLKLATPWTTAFGTYIYTYISSCHNPPLLSNLLKFLKTISWGPQIPASHIYKLFPILLTASSPDSPLAVWLYFSLKSLLLTVTEPGCWRRLGPPPKVYSRPPLQQTGKQLQARKPVRALFLSPHDYPAPSTKSTPGRESRI